MNIILALFPVIVTHVDAGTLAEWTVEKCEREVPYSVVNCCVAGGPGEWQWKWECANPILSGSTMSLSNPMTFEAYCAPPFSVRDVSICRELMHDELAPEAVSGLHPYSPPYCFVYGSSTCIHRQHDALQPLCTSEYVNYCYEHIDEDTALQNLAECPHDSTRWNQLLQNAEAAQKRAKGTGDRAGEKEAGKDLNRLMVLSTQWFGAMS